MRKRNSNLVFGNGMKCIFRVVSKSHNAFLDAIVKLRAEHRSLAECVVARVDGSRERLGRIERADAARLTITSALRWRLLVAYY